jgi:ABC-2 type transport system ATP-binding protein
MDGQVNNIVIKVHDVSKRIRDRLILENIHLTVPSGVIYGIKGRNGAGKSMLLRVIAGFVRPSQGEVFVFGDAIGSGREFPRDTGAIIDGPGLLPHYTGFRNLQLLAMICRKINSNEIEQAMHLVGLDPQDARPVRTYSTGMRQRLALAQALMEHPSLLLLDEPTSAIDYAGRKEIYSLLCGLRSSGVTIVMTSHSEEEIQTLCDAIIFMENGHLSLS